LTIMRACPAVSSGDLRHRRHRNLRAPFDAALAAGLPARFRLSRFLF
jgi:hypothetical protein